MFEDGFGKRCDIIKRRRETALQERAGADGEHQGLSRARTGAPGEMFADVGSGVRRTGRADEGEDGVDDLIADGEIAHEVLDGHESFGSQSRFGGLMVRGCGFNEDAAFGGLIGVVDVDLHQEAVELGFGQGIGALLLDRVLGGEDVEGAGQIVAHAGDGDVIFLHGLKQSGLGAGAGAVDLVGHQQLREDGAFEEAEGAAVIGRLLHDFGAENIGGHQIGRELDALFREAENGAHGFDELGFGEARDADNQGVAAGEDRGQRVVKDGFLTENDVR